MNWLSVKLAKKPEARLQLIEEAITERSEQAIKFLLLAVQDEHASVRLAAVEAFGKIRCAEAVKDLGKLVHVEDFNTRQAVVTSLGQIGGDGVIGFLAEALHDNSFEIRRTAARALQTLKWKPDTSEQRALLQVALGDFNGAAKEGDAAIEALGLALNDENCPNRRAAVAVLGKFRDERVTSVLARALTAADTSLRLTILEALGNLGDLSAVPALSALLKDSDPQVRGAAAKALTGLPDSAALDDLIPALKDTNAAVRKAAAETLGKISDGRAVLPLVEALNDPIHDVRHVVAEALGRLSDVRATEGLIAALVDPQVTVRHAAEEALSKTAPDWEKSPAAMAALPALKNAMQSKDYWVRHPAADLLNRIFNAQKISAPADIAPLLEKHNIAVEALLEFVDDRDRDVRQAIVEALRRVTDARSIPALKNRAQDSDPWIRRSACTALESLGQKPPANNPQSA